ncbi:hypothetical protein C8R45DRAFT_924354 [Mycena sanguinolenta]|nr:hypothetical protein C8R45DRAFT_924354 [Mycena sanguinolenta]
MAVSHRLLPTAQFVLPALLVALLWLLVDATINAHILRKVTKKDDFMAQEAVLGNSEGTIPIDKLHDPIVGIKDENPKLAVNPLQTHGLFIQTVDTDTPPAMSCSSAVLEIYHALKFAQILPPSISASQNAHNRYTDAEQGGVNIYVDQRAEESQPRLSHGDEKQPSFDWHCETQARQREPKSIRGLPANRLIEGLRMTSMRFRSGSNHRGRVTVLNKLNTGCVPMDMEVGTGGMIEMSCNLG